MYPRETIPITIQLTGNDSNSRNPGPTVATAYVKVIPYLQAPIAYDQAGRTLITLAEGEATTIQIVTVDPVLPDRLIAPTAPNFFSTDTSNRVTVAIGNPGGIENTLGNLLSIGEEQLNALAGDRGFEISYGFSPIPHRFGSVVIESYSVLVNGEATQLANFQPITIQITSVNDAPQVIAVNRDDDGDVVFQSLSTNTEASLSFVTEQIVDLGRLSLADNTGTVNTILLGSNGRGVSAAYASSPTASPFTFAINAGIEEGLVDLQSSFSNACTSLFGNTLALRQIAPEQENPIFADKRIYAVVANNRDNTGQRRIGTCDTTLELRVPDSDGTSAGLASATIRTYRVDLNIQIEDTDDLPVIQPQGDILVIGQSGLGFGEVTTASLKGVGHQHC